MIWAFYYNKKKKQQIWLKRLLKCDEHINCQAKTYATYGPKIEWY